MRMQGKIGLVTAAASGAGRAGALIFAREGAAVCIADQDEDAAQAVVEEILVSGGRAIAVCGDLRSDKMARNIVAATVQEFGGLDFVWNHLGVPGPAAFEELKMEDWEFAIDLNIRSQLNTTIAALPHLRERGGGSILFTSSTSGLSGSPWSPIYSAAKSGVIGLTRALAKRYAKEKIRINAICPGPIDSPMLRVFVNRPDQPGSKDADVAELVKRAAALSPMGRAARPEEIGHAALFLLSDDASYVTGIAMPVDGGMLA
jgi:NAD(P)-dependent dehydrogenase (short-subunit alcohol dehydrogenase family)